MSATEAHEHAPFIDYENLPAPTEGILVTQFITVRSVARSRAFYSEVLGGQVVLEENPCIVKLANSWVLMNPGGPPTPDKPDISVVNYESGNTVSSFMNLRVADIEACFSYSPNGAARDEGRRALGIAQSRASGCRGTRDRFHPPAASRRAIALATKRKPGRGWC